jgi:hypothetical protein
MVSVTINQTMFDRWSWVHTLMGVGVGFAGVNPALAISGAVAFDVIEHYHEAPRGSKLFGSKAPESLKNVIGDLLVYSIGYAAALEIRDDEEVPVATVAAFGAAALLGIVFAHKAGCECPVQATPPASIQGW